MPGMERLGGAFSPRASRAQKGMAPQMKFNMPKMGGGLTPMNGTGSGGGGNMNPTMPRGPGGGGTLPTPRPPSTMQPGMGGGGVTNGGFQSTMPTVGGGGNNMGNALRKMK